MGVRMKKSEAIEKLVVVLEENSSENVQAGLMTHEVFDTYATVRALLDYAVNELGMLPPTNTCKLIPDPIRGGQKHSESKREWDDE